jgi:hypothetical protein
MPSRRPSLQHGSTTNIVHEDLLHDDLPDLPSTTRSPTQAPIGTRPQSSASHLPVPSSIPPTPPKALNPAAPVFKGIFTSKKSEEEKAEKAKRAAEKAAEKEARKAEKEATKAEKKEGKERAKSDKSARKEKEKLLALESSANDSGRDTNSPLDPRRSRDNRSISTVDVSEASPRESLERSVSMTSDHHSNANLLGKETLMQKLSRKSSSSQFLQFGKGKSSLFSKKPSENATPDETEEDMPGTPGLLSRYADSSAGNSPSIGTPKDKSSALSWSSIKRMGKRGDKTPSINESIASETTGDEDEEGVDAAKATS